MSTKEEIKKSPVEAAREICLQALINTGAIKVAPNEGDRYTLRNQQFKGEVFPSWWFVNMDKVATERVPFRSTVDAMSAMVMQSFPDQEHNVIINVASKDSAQYAGALSYTLGGKQGILRPDVMLKVEKGPSDKPLLLPDGLGTGTGYNFIIIDGVVTTGQTAIETTREIRKQCPDGNIALAAAVARNPAFANRLFAPEGIRLLSMATLDDIIDSQWGSLTEEQQMGTIQEMKTIGSDVRAPLIDTMPKLQFRIAASKR